MSLFKSFPHWVFADLLIDLWKFFIHSEFKSFSSVCTVIISLLYGLPYHPLKSVSDEQKFFISNVVQVTRFASQHFLRFVVLFSGD